MMGEVGNRKSEAPVGRRFRINLNRGAFSMQGRKGGSIVPLWNYELPQYSNPGITVAQKCSWLASLSRLLVTCRSLDLGKYGDWGI